LSVAFWFVLPVFLAVAWFAPQICDRWFVKIEEYGAHFSRRKGIVILAVFLTAIVVRIALLAVSPVPEPAVHDEFSYLLQADTFLHGRLANPPHQMWVYLDTFHVLQHPTYAPKFPPAQGAALALGGLLGSPWIGVLFSAALMCAVMTWMLQGWLPAPWAMLGALLIMLRIYLFSYWIDSYWGGAIAAAGGALVLGSFPRLLKRVRIRDALVMGVGIVLLANSRPLEGLVFCIPIAVAFCIWLFNQRSPSLAITGPRLLLPLFFAVGVGLIFILYDNWRVTNNAFLFPHALYDQQYINYRIFHWQHLNPPLKYLNPQFENYFNGWVRQAFDPSWHLFLEEGQSFLYFFLGSVLSLALIAVPSVVRDRRTRLPFLVLVWCLLALLPVSYFEPHYAAPMAAAFYIVVVQAMRHMRHWEIRGRPAGIFLTRLIVLLCIARVGVLALEAYRHPLLNWSIRRATIVKSLRDTPGKHLVVVRYAHDHDVHREWVYNAADIDKSEIVWAREIPGVDPKPLFEYFRDRKVWLVEADESPATLQPYHGDEH
jgi:hypothetical protein